jgi:hypothetical protein
MKNNNVEVSKVKNLTMANYEIVKLAQLHNEKPY